MLALIVVVLGAVLARVGTLQTGAGEELRERGARQWTRTTEVSASRGSIFDRHGQELAMSVPAATVSINPKQVTEPGRTVDLLADLLGLDDDRRLQLLDEVTAQERGFLYVARQIDDGLGAQIDALGLPGVDVTPEPRRTLPGGDTGRSIIGLTDIDGNGIAGLEQQYDELLTGTPGELVREVAPGGSSIAGTERILAEPVPGDDLMLTIDRSIQFAAEEALINQVSSIGARGGTAIVLDTDTGEVLAMASVRRDDTSGRVEITSGNYAAVDAYEPGSVAKVITIASALEEGVVTPQSSFLVPWRKQYADDLLKDAEQHPTEWYSVEQILVKSSNIGTIMVKEEVGRQRHWEYMRAFGLGEATALDFPGESTGILNDWDDLWGSERATVAYGQGVSSTSIQLAAAINVIANDGTYVAPKLVAATVDHDGDLIETPPSATHQVVSTQTAETMQGMMQQVVCRGTAKRAQVEHFNVAGKTGTGFKAQANGTYWDENGNRVYYSSFVGYFPTEDPQVTLLISIDEPPARTNDRFGGTAAAPVFAELAPAIVHERGIQPPTDQMACGGTSG